MTAWLCEFARADGLAGFVRLDRRDGHSLAWYWTYLVGVPGIDGVVAVREHEVPQPRQGLEIRAEGLWAELTEMIANEHWTFGLEAFGVVLDDPDDARRPGGEIGERIAVGLDIEWEAPALVHGDVLVGRDEIALDAWGRVVVGHELVDDVLAGEARARVVVPLDDGSFCLRTLVLTGDGALRWSQRVETTP